MVYKHFSFFTLPDLIGYKQFLANDKGTNFSHAKHSELVKKNKICWMCSIFRNFLYLCAFMWNKLLT
jgi:hypothetical protein